MLQGGSPHIPHNPLLPPPPPPRGVTDPPLSPEAIVQSKLDMPLYKIQFRLWEHARTPGEATAAQKRSLKLGQVQLSLQYSIVKDVGDAHRACSPLLDWYGPAGLRGRRLRLSAEVEGDCCLLREC